MLLIEESGNIFKAFMKIPSWSDAGKHCLLRPKIDVFNPLSASFALI